MQSLVKAIISTMLKIVAVTCQLLNVDVIGQGGKVVFVEKVRGKILVFTKNVRKIFPFWLKVREIFVKKSI